MTQLHGSQRKYALLDGLNPDNMDEKLLKLKRTIFDVVVRDCGRIHLKIIKFFGDDTDLEGYLSLIDAAINTYTYRKGNQPMKNILEICQALHQFNMGSLHEPHFGETEYRNMYIILQSKLKNWRNPHPKAEIFDNTVKNLIYATIHECDQTYPKILHGETLNNNLYNNDTDVIDIIYNEPNKNKKPTIKEIKLNLNNIKGESDENK
jgi:signal recognition particle subunit SEC65